MINEEANTLIYSIATTGYTNYTGLLNAQISSTSLNDINLKISTTYAPLTLHTGIPKDYWMNGTENSHIASLPECICSDLYHDDYSQLYAWFNYIIIIIMLPSLSIFGILTNFINIFIFSRKRMCNSANTYLCFLACSDFMVIVTGLFIFWIDSARSYFDTLEHAPYTTIYTLPLGYMAQTCSIYFTVAAAFDCYISVCCPQLARSYCISRRARQINGFIVICSVLYNSPRFWQFQLRKCIHDGSSQEAVLEICPTGLFFEINTVYNVYLYMILMTLLPFCLLLILNAFIIIKQTLSQRKAENKPSNKKSKEMKTQISGTHIHMQNSITNITQNNQHNNFNEKEAIVEKNNPNTASASYFVNNAQNRNMSCILTQSQNNPTDDTLTMIMVVILFLSCNTLALIVNVIETFFEPDALLLNLLSDTSNFLVVFNSSVNCIIYMIFNNDYREYFIIYLFKLKRSSFNFFDCRTNREKDIKLKKQLHFQKNGKQNHCIAKRFIYDQYGTVGINCRIHEENKDELESNSHDRCVSPIWYHSESALGNNSIKLENEFGCKCDVPLIKSNTRLSFQPSNCETLLLADDDSNLDESVTTTTLFNNFYERNSKRSTALFHPQATSYLAGIKIMHDSNKNADELACPHIYVCSLSKNNNPSNSNNSNNVKHLISDLP